MGDYKMVTEVNVNKCTINDLFVQYVENRLYVNRKYQRKLVWNIYDKKLLIDSIIRGVPLPTLLLSEYKENGKTYIEIADGMQRTEAIISFLLGEFPVKYDDKECYFCPDDYAETFNLVRDGKIKKRDGVNYLPRNICIDFYKSEIPVIITGKDEEAIELIFSRINSTGRKISSQDLRQSRAVGDFPDLVRRIACRIRGDYTYTDRICLGDMKKISVGDVGHGYGVDIDTVFWRKHDLVTNPGMKESKDEEIIESLLATILLPDTFRKSKDSLDALYDANSQLGKLIEDNVLKLGKDDLENKFVAVFDQISNIFNAVDSNFSDWIFDGQKTIKNKDICFSILFCALYRLTDESYTIDNYENVALAIKNARNTFDTVVTSAKVDYSEISTQTENLYCLLKDKLIKQITVNEVSEIEREIDRRLKYSSIERQMTEFKIAVSDHKANRLSPHCMERIEETLVAMANVEDPTEMGMIVIGIADNKDAYDAWKSVYHKNAILVEQHYVTGIADEAMKLYGSVDQYFRSVAQSIRDSKMSEDLKSFVLQHMEVVNFHGKEVLVLYSFREGESLFNGTKWIRESNATVEAR